MTNWARNDDTPIKIKIESMPSFHLDTEKSSSIHFQQRSSNSRLHSSSSPSFSTAPSINESPTFNSSESEFERFGNGTPKHEQVQPDMFFYTALTNIYNAAKQLRSKQETTEINNESKQPQRAIKKIDSTDEFRFPVYTGVVFRPKKEINPDRNRSLDRASIKVEAKPEPEPVSNSFEEISIRIQKSTVSTIEQSSTDQAFPEPLLAPSISSSSSTSSSSSMDDSSAINERVSKLVFKYLSPDTNKNNTNGRNKPTYSQVSYDAEKTSKRSLELEKNLKNLAAKCLLERSASTLRANIKSPEVSAPINRSMSTFRLNEKADKKAASQLSLVKAKLNSFKMDKSLSKLPGQGLSMVKPIKVILKKPNNEVTEASLQAKNTTQKSKNKVTFKLPIEQVSYNKQKSASSFLRSYRSGSDSDYKSQSRDQLQLGSYYGGASDGYADKFNKQSARKRYSAALDYNALYGQQMGSGGDMRQLDSYGYNQMYAYRNLGYRVPVGDYGAYRY